MIKKFISDVAVVQFLNLLVKPLWIFAIDRTAQNILPTSDYGAYFTIMGFSLMFVVFLDLGVTGFNTTSGAENTFRLKKRFAQIASIKLVLAGFYFVIVLSIGLFFGYTSNYFYILFGVVGIQILSSFNVFFRGIVSAMHLFKFEGIFMILERLIAILICSILIWGNLHNTGLTIINFTYAQLLATAIVSAFLLIFIFKNLQGVHFNFTMLHVRQILLRSWPFALLTALMGLYHYLDAVMLEQISKYGTVDVGIYALGFRLFFVLLMFTHVFSNILLPMFSRKKNDLAYLKNLSLVAIKILLWIAVGTAMLSCSFQYDIIKYLYPQKFSVEAAHSFSWLMLGFVGTIFVVIYGTLLTALKKLKHLNLLLVFTVLINIILNAALIPRFGASGAAIATFVSQCILGFGSLVISYTLLNWKYDFRFLLKSFLYGIIAFLGIFYTNKLDLNIFLLLSSIVLTGVFGFFLMGLHKIKNLDI